MIYPGSGSISENGGSTLLQTGKASAQIKAVVCLSVGTASLSVLANVTGVPEYATLPILVTVNGYGTPSLSLRVDVGTTGKPTSAVLRVDVISASFLSGATTAANAGALAAQWGVVVEIDAVDVTVNLVGEVSVEAEESSARIADFSMEMASGVTVYPTDWVGKQVRVFFVDMSSGTAASAILLFSGIVDVPSINIADAVIHLRCTDDRPGIIGAMSEAQIAALLPGSRWSSSVFKSGASPLVHSSDRLSTIPCALDLDASRIPRLANWEAKTTADFSFTADQILDQSVSVDLSERSSLVNTVDVAFSYRFPRIKAEGWLLGFDPIALAHSAFKYWIRDGNLLLQRAAVEAALSKAGSKIVSISWMALPTTAQIIPGSGGSPAGVWLPNPPVDAQYCLGFSAVVAFDYGQTVDEAHEITVTCPASVASIGPIRETVSGSLEGVYDDIKAAEQNILSYRGDLTRIPPNDIAPISAGFTTSVDATLSADSDRAAADTAMETLIAVARAKIHGAHRRNSVRAAIPCLPVLDIVHTVSFVAQGITTKGKIRRLSHRLNVDSGSAITEFDLAICSASGVGVVHADDTISAPAGSSATSTALVGSAISWNGLNGQDGVITINFPGVASAERNLLSNTIKTTHFAPIYEDLLEVTP